ncbi:MAG: Do family serine endopeptidase [Candidatus Omnitrophota bacterium]
MKPKLCWLISGLIIGVLTTANFNKFPKVFCQDGSFSLKDAVINVANTTGKAVVSISSEHVKKIAARKLYRSSPFGNDEMLRRFFGDFFGEIPEREFRQKGMGSGVIISQDGYILTNDHVVNSADKISITLADGREFEAQLKGTDPHSDLAVIKIDAKDLPAAPLGDSDKLQIGEWVTAIGNPFGFALQNPEPTVTTGVISALHRALRGRLLKNKNYNDLIQTDAAINPGNSGGPLVNLNGEVIGINVALFSTTGGYQGLGFAIPINNAKRIISRLKQGKEIEHGWMGITVQDLTKDLANYFKLTNKNGVLIGEVIKDGSADKAGLKTQDIIVSFNNMPINNVRELLTTIGKMETGGKLKVGLIRNNKPIALDVILEKRPQEGKEEEPISEPKQQAEEITAWRGLTVENITPNLKQQLNIEKKSGVIIVKIEPNSPADSSGLKQGDIILEINKFKINNTADYTRAIKNSQGDSLIKAQRGYFILK